MCIRDRPQVDAHQKILNMPDEIRKEKLLTDLKKGSMSDIEVAPCLIREVLYPFGMPDELCTYIESALDYQSSSNYIMAIKNLEAAKKICQQKPQGEIPDEIFLFIEFSIGSVYESAGRDDYALNQYLNCRSYTEKFDFMNPDRALPYCGLGSVFYHAEDYEWATRCFLKGRDIREQVLGGDTPDTATMYNNLGCCMFSMNRFEEAYSYFLLAEAIFRNELGPYHFRTMTSARNVQKTKKQLFYSPPVYNQLWEMYVDCLLYTSPSPRDS
eukprot:TRINITY_DN3522_c0_g3_i3.p1 TRINITY_DN3522_c0_g3~~TRINITY_DN3522_c0_g3_i3.p1  ORF type:complete len:270 (-),score=49.98 TRINITY_DN3522_c0_g3_i3:87-896(-)